MIVLCRLSPVTGLQVNQEFDMMYSDLVSESRFSLGVRFQCILLAHFITCRLQLGQYKTTDPNYCTNTATGNELSHDDCYQRLKNDVQSTTESQLGLIGLSQSPRQPRNLVIAAHVSRLVEATDIAVSRDVIQARLLWA